MNLASTGTEMDFLSQPVNQPQETNMREKFWNALYLLQMYENCIKINSQGFVFQSLVFLFKPTDLKGSWCLLLRQRQKPCNFLSKPREVSKYPPWEICFNTLPFHNAPTPKGQTWAQPHKPASVILFKMFSYTNAWCRWTKGVNMEILEVRSSASRP